MAGLIVFTTDVPGLTVNFSLVLLFSQTKRNTA